MTDDPEISNMLRSDRLTEVRDIIRDRRIFKRVSTSTEAISQAIMGLGTCLAFASTAFEYPLLSFLAGISGTIALVLQRYAAYSSRVSKELDHTVQRLVTTGDTASNSEGGIAIELPTMVAPLDRKVSPLNQ